MKKILIFLSFVLFLSPLGVLAEEASLTDLPKEDAYKAIVKIKRFVEDEDGFIGLTSYGSGVLINSSGLILTNEHVAVEKFTLDNSRMDSSYIVCIPDKVNEKPVCSYTARFIASDEDLDIALLQIENIPGKNGLSSYDFLNIDYSDSSEVNDEIFVLGYPAIGQESITMTKGIVSGKINKDNKDWIKTDAVVSFGNSGGASINSDGDVVGITSRSSSDMLGSLGYIINTKSLETWIEENKNLSPKSLSTIQTRTNSFYNKYEESLSETEFSLSNPDVSFTRPDNWKFNYNSEDSLIISKAGGSLYTDGGVFVRLHKYPFVVSDNELLARVKRDFMSDGTFPFLSILSDEEIVINGAKGKKITTSLMGDLDSSYGFNVDEYVVEISYHYGENDKNKDVILEIINSMKINHSNKVISDIKRNYNKTYGVYFTVGEDWAILSKQDESKIATIYNKKYPDAYISVSTEKLDEELSDFDNEEYLEYQYGVIEKMAPRFKSLNMEVKFGDYDPEYKLNDEINNAMVSEAKFLYENNPSMYGEGIEIRIKNNKLLTFSLFVGKDALPNYDEIKNDFINIAKTASFNNYRDYVNESNVIGKRKTEEIPEVNIKEEQIEEKDEPRQDMSQRMFNVKDKSMYSRLRGKIMIKVEDSGKAYYVNPKTETIHYLGRPKDAFAVMREQGVGITNKDLYKIPVGIANNSGKDSDGDGLSDNLEDTLGLNSNKKDTDGDGYNDKDELVNGYNPWGSGKQNIDNNFSTKQNGKILLQVEKNGEAWYVNPNNGRRYFLGRPADAFNVMRGLGLGISNGDFSKMSE